MTALKRLATAIVTIAFAVKLSAQSGSTEDSRFNFALSLLYLDGSGSPDAPYLGFAEEKDYDGLVPRLSFAWSMSERLQLSASYTDLGTLEASWIAPQSPPFEGGGFQVITPFDISEDMDSVGASLRYAIGIGSGSLKIGGGLEWVRNEHKGWTEKKEEDWSFAFLAEYEQPITESLSLSIEYLQIEPPRKTLHLLGGSLAWKF